MGHHNLDDTLDSMQPPPDMHMSEEEQVLAMKIITELVRVGESIYSNEDRWPLLVTAIGDNNSRELAEVTDLAHSFVDAYGKVRGLPHGNRRLNG